LNIRTDGSINKVNKQVGRFSSRPYRSIFFCVEVISSTLVVRKQRNTLRYDTVEVENQLKVHGKRVETNLVTGNLTSKVINSYETKNPSTLPSMSSILIYFQSLIQSEASNSQLATRNSQLATRSSQNSRPRNEYVFTRSNF
jgi:hypothetical protein